MVRGENGGGIGEEVFLVYIFVYCRFVGGGRRNVGEFFWGVGELWVFCGWS